LIASAYYFKHNFSGAFLDCRVYRRSRMLNLWRVRLSVERAPFNISRVIPECCGVIADHRQHAWPLWCLVMHQIVIVFRNTVFYDWNNRQCFTL